MVVTLAPSDVGDPAGPGAAAHHARAPRPSCSVPPGSTRSSWSTSPRGGEWSPGQFVDGVLRPLRPAGSSSGRTSASASVPPATSAPWPSSGRASFVVQALPLVTDGSHPSSSTLIRHAVSDGDFGRVRELERPSVPLLRGGGPRGPTGSRARLPDRQRGGDPGTRGPGRRRVRGLGDPTGRRRHPRWPAAISVGTNPTFDGVGAHGSRPTCWTVTTSSLLRRTDRHRLLRPAPRPGEVRRPGGADRADARRCRPGPSPLARRLTRPRPAPASVPAAPAAETWVNPAFGRCTREVSWVRREKRRSAAGPVEPPDSPHPAGFPPRVATLVRSRRRSIGRGPPRAPIHTV